MASKPPSDTRQRIQDVARELFAARGVQRTSLQDIADRLGLTKPALYYHFASREELVRSIVAPLIDEGERFIAAQEQQRVRDPRALLEGYFDFHYRHRADLLMIVAELSTLAELGLIDLLLAWRDRLGKLVLVRGRRGPGHPRCHRLRRSAGLLPAVSRHVGARASDRRRRWGDCRAGVARRGLGSEDMRFGLFIPQGWRLDLVDIPAARHWEVMNGTSPPTPMPAPGTRCGSTTTSTPFRCRPTRPLTKRGR